MSNSCNFSVSSRWWYLISSNHHNAHCFLHIYFVSMLSGCHLSVVLELPSFLLHTPSPCQAVLISTCNLSTLPRSYSTPLPLLVPFVSRHPCIPHDRLTPRGEARGLWPPSPSQTLQASHTQTQTHTPQLLKPSQGYSEKVREDGGRDQMSWLLFCKEEMRPKKIRSCVCALWFCFFTLEKVVGFFCEGGGGMETMCEKFPKFKLTRL